MTAPHHCLLSQMPRCRLQDISLLDFTPDWWPDDRHVGFCLFLKAALTLHFLQLLGFSLLSTALESWWKLVKKGHQLPPSTPWGAAGQVPGRVWVFSAPAWPLTWPLNQAGSSSPPSLRAEAWQTLLVTTSRVVKTCLIHACCHWIPYPTLQWSASSDSWSSKASTAPDTSCKPVEFWLPLFCL